MMKPPPTVTKASSLPISKLFLQSKPLLEKTMKSFYKPEPHDYFPILTPTQRNFVSRYKRKLLKNNPSFSSSSDDINRKASILIPLVDIEDKPNDPSIIFTLRSANLSSHANEISFPGGHFESSLDRTLMDTALRESREELLPSKLVDHDLHSSNHESYYCISRSSVDIIGRMEDIPSKNGTKVTSYLGLLSHTFPSSLSISTNYLPGNANEVERVFTLSISELLEMETTIDHDSRLGKNAPVYKSSFGDIWGLTAFILKPLLHQVLKPVFTTYKSSNQ